jgi:hypothetical protein
MTTIPPWEAVPGVEKDPDETEVYHVESFSTPGNPYRVDMTCYRGNGRCTCPDFELRKMGKLERGAEPSRAMQCKHIRAVREYQSYLHTFAETTIKERATNAIRKENQARKLDNCARSEIAATLAATATVSQLKEGSWWDATEG